MELTVPSSNVSARPATQMASSAPELDAPGVGKAPEGAKAPDESVLVGEGVTVSLAFSDRLDVLRKSVAPDKAEVLMEMMNSYFQTLQTTAKNLAPSEKEIELRKRRKAELEKQIRDLEAKKVTVEEALVRFENTFLAAADKDLLEANMARQRQEIV